MQQQEATTHSDPTRGITQTILARGLGRDQALAQADYYQSLGIEVTYTERFGVYDLHAVDSTFNNPIDDWELSGDEEHKDLFQNPRWANALTDKQVAAIRVHLSNNETPTKAFSAGNTAVDGGGNTVEDLSPLAGGIVQRAYARYQSGNDEFSNDAYGGGYVLRHTTNVPFRWGTNIADFNVGAIYSTAHLLTEVSNSSLWVLPIPARLYYKISNLPVPTIREYFQWGWKKSRSTEHTMANHRISIVQHYILEQWSTDDYAAF